MKRIIGVLILLSVFVGLFAMVAASLGVIRALVVFESAIALAAIIAVGADLMAD